MVHALWAFAFVVGAGIVLVAVLFTTVFASVTTRIECRSCGARSRRRRGLCRSCGRPLTG